MFLTLAVFACSLRTRKVPISKQQGSLQATKALMVSECPWVGIRNVTASAENKIVLLFSDLYDI